MTEEETKGQVTVGSLIATLEQYPRELPVVLAYNWGEPKVLDYTIDEEEDDAGQRLIAIHGGELQSPSVHTMTPEELDKAGAGGWPHEPT